VSEYRAEKIPETGGGIEFGVNPVTTAPVRRDPETKRMELGGGITIASHLSLPAQAKEY